MCGVLKFTAKGTTAQFKAKLTPANGDVQEKGQDYSTSVGADWVTAEANNNDGWYKVTGLTNGKEYRIDITGNSNISFKYRVVDVNPTPTKLYLYNTSLEKKGESTIKNGTYIFDVTLSAQEYFVLSTVDLKSGEGWNQLNAGRYSPTSAQGDKEVPCTACPFSKTDGSGKAWFVPENTATAKYTITVNWSNQTLTAEKAIDVVWRLDGNTSPDKIIVHGTEGTTGDFVMDWNDAAATNCWSTKFIAQKQNATFTIELFKGEVKETYGQNVTVAAGNMSNELTLDRSAQGSTYKLSGLKIGKKYRLKLMGTGDNKFKYTVEEVPGDNILYLYEMDSASATTVKQIGGGVAVGEDGKCTFEANLTAGKYIVLSRNGGATTATGIQTYNGRYTPVASSSIPCTKSVFKNSNSGAWKVDVTDKYTITVDWTAKTLTALGESNLPDAPANLYLYKINNDASVFKMIGSSPCNGNIYTYTVYIENGMKIVLSSISDATGWEGDNGINRQVDGKYVRYNPAGTLNIPGNDRAFALNEQTGDYKDGIWQTTQEGRYTITVNWATKTLTATCTYMPPTGTHMPLNSADFANGKKHYFLVGERMGEWHLQPEWEFEKQGNELVLKDRYIYTGKFAIGMVSDFNDYKVHKYNYYAKDLTFKYLNESTPVLKCDQDLSGTERQYAVNPNVVNKITENVFMSNMDGGDYTHGRGVYMKEIRVTLTDDGEPQTIEFVPGTPEEAAQNRIFTLLGSKIYNTEYCNSSSNTHTTMYNRGYCTDDGWQEGWIQYDPATNKPYVDGNGEYIYHTSFTPDYLTANPVRFSQPLASGDDFTFSSANVQFVEWNKLSNLDSDPYKGFYQAYTLNQTIKTDAETVKAGEGFRFYPKVDDDKSFTPTADWHCYVVRDMWIAGEIKFWTGWGGNPYSTHGNDNIADWFGPNGGPSVAAGGVKPVRGYDVNAGVQAVLYPNQRQVQSNYKVSDGKPVYFNRVVLWFNNTDGVGDSFIQFIQESCGPAILAYASTNDSYPDKKNYIDYNWYLNKVAEGQEEMETQIVTGYRIRRYRVENNAMVFMGYTEGDDNNFVDISSYNATVASLYEDNAGQYEFTKFHDKGVRGLEGFAPGLYQYDIYVQFEGGKEKLAVSNRVPIYGDDLVNPDAIAMQLVQLRDEYYDAYSEDPHASGKTTLETALGLTPGTFETRFAGGLTETVDITGKGGVVTGQEEKVSVYLTYRPNDNVNFYVTAMQEKTVVVGGTEYTSTVPYKPMIVDSKKVLAFMNENPDKFWWTSDYYLRCLDWNQYESLMNSFIDAGIIQAGPEAGVPLPEISVTEDIAQEGSDKPLTLTHGRAVKYDFDNNQSYYATIVKRGGTLADATFNVVLDYSYKGANGEDKNETASTGTVINPVVPRPYRPLYRYNYRRLETNPKDNYDYGKILVPVGDITGKTQQEAIDAGLLKEAYIKFEGEEFTPRTFDLQVDFYRPNVNKDIYTFYDIQYDVTLENSKELVPLNMEAVLHDVDYEEKKYPNRYRMEFYGMHPRNDIYPVVTFVKTEYIPRKTGDGLPSNPNKFKTQVGTFGEKLVIECKRAIDVNHGEKGLQNVHLGWIERSDGKYDWMYKGHEDFEDPNETEKPVDNKYEDKDATNSFEPLYYLIEVEGTQGEYSMYNYLVPHHKNHQDGMKDATGRVVIKTDPKLGYILNDTDPLIGTYIAKDFNTNEFPTVKATAMYIFQRNITGADRDDVISTNFNRLVVISQEFKSAGTQSSANAPARIREDATNSDWANEGAGDLPYVGTVPQVDESRILDMSKPDATTGYNAFVAARGATYSSTPIKDNVTGVEDVIADGECGESVYYNMQGMRIEKPETPGVYFRVDGKKVTKFVVK